MSLIHPALVGSVRRRRVAASLPALLSALFILSSAGPGLSREQGVELADAANVDASPDHLAGREMDIGRYYLSKRDNTAAINRFRTVVTHYQQTKHVEEALGRLTDSYLALGNAKQAQTAAAVLGRKFPDSRWSRDARDELRSDGLQPHEDESSWISQAFR
jgi:outer membrane lipoprotein YfiO